MPLQEGSSDEVIEANIKELMAAGHSRDQASAIALKTAGRPAQDSADQRYDSAALLQPPIKSAAGYLRIPARLTRVGVLSYLQPDGSTIKEFRPPDEVFSPASLDSLRLAPVTRGHPRDDKGVYPARARALARGAVGDEIKQDGEFVAATLGVFDQELIDAVEAGGEREVSCGYLRRFDPTPGEYKGERYDGVQRDIRYNHVAIVTKGRAGPDVALRMDEQQKGPDGETGEHMAKVMVGGTEYECPPELADALALQAKEAAKQDAAQAVEKEKARADAAEAQLKQVQDSAAKIPELVKARVALERSVSGLVENEKIDGMSDIEIKKAAIAKVLPDLKLDGASDTYISGAFEAAMKAKPSATQAGLSAVRGAGVGQRGDEKSPYEKMVEWQRNAWKEAK